MTLAPETTAAGRRGTSRPIASYGLLSDCNSAALVGTDGSIDWLCLPRFDSPSVFGAILDPDAGHWSIAPVGDFTTTRRYAEGSLVIETTFTTPTGSVLLRDALAFAEGQRGHDIGLDAPHELVRSVVGLSGTVDLALELAPRPEYGLVRPLVRATEDGARTFGGPNQVALRASVPVAVEDGTVTAAFAIAAGETAGFALRWIPRRPARPPASTTPSRRGARGRPSTPSTRASIASSSGSRPAC
jgi:GH15 family glucan-1,4-alpha-glucosidase